MNKNKLFVLSILCLIFLLLERFLHISIYAVILFMTLGFGFVWYSSEAKITLKASKDRQNLKKQLKSSSTDAYLKHKQMQTIISMMPFPLILMDEDGKIVLYNGHAAILRKGNDERKLTYFDNDFIEQVQSILKDAYILENKMEKIIKINERDYQCCCVPVITHGHFGGSLIIFQDISNALEGERMQKRFIADASHELKTPISVIKGMVEILNRPDFDDMETQKDFNIQIQKEVLRLENIVKDLLELSKLSVSTPILHYENVNLHQLIHDTCHSLIPLMNEKKLQFKENLEGDAMLYCDPLKITQVINNLVVNAIKYSESGTIEVATRSDDNFYYLIVKDQGCGLFKEDQKKIFDRFYRVSNSRSRQKGGVGLGLSIVKSITDAHDAIIEVDSKINEGTTFTIKFKMK